MCKAQLLVGRIRSYPTAIMVLTQWKQISAVWCTSSSFPLQHQFTPWSMYHC
uniref:Uncharacterized protein n=1 Tax=Arundo donax TaxID=35708 RepID=A0A0A9AFY5_ARUDO